MAIDKAQFRVDFPEFSDTAAFPDAVVTFWLGIGYKRFPSTVWQELLDIGVELFTAHNITLERQSKAAAAAGGTPGQQVGPLNNKSVSKVSAGYDTASGSVEGAGNYNLTNYGTRLADLIDIVGAQGMGQIGTGCFPAGTVIGG